jgi:hypothetical protein
MLGNNIISLPRYWCLKKWEEFQNKLHYILSQDAMLLPVQVLERTLDLVPAGTKDLSWEDIDLISPPLIGYWLH